MIPARMNASWITVLPGIAVGAICAALIAIPAIPALEQQYGLQGPFDLRGAVEPPGHAVLVLMNERSADSNSLPRDAERFRRCADLRVGVLFRERAPLPAAGGDLQAWQDEIMSRAMAMTHVVIAQKVDGSGGQEQIAALSPAIADAAQRIELMTSIGS